MLRLSCRASICGQSATVPLEGPAPFIIGGDLASSGQWPWALALMYRGQYRCSAVLIDNGWAMTAAHCFFWSNGYTLEFLPHYFTLRAGTNSLITDDEHTRSFKVRRIVLHPTYTVSTNGFRYQDVALIQLETEVEFTDYIRPACMPESEQTFPRTSTCYITGWGYTKTAASEFISVYKRHFLYFQFYSKASGPIKGSKNESMVRRTLQRATWLG